MGQVGRIASVCLLMVAWCTVAAGMPVAVFTIDKESIAQMRKHHPLASVDVEDPVYKRKERYQGFWLRDVVTELGQRGHPEADLYVRFRCKDGYLPIMPLARALAKYGVTKHS